MSEIKKDIILSLDDVVVEYTQGGEIVHAVNGISLQLERGEALGLVGETGAGKTTLCKAILRILPLVAAKQTRGTITYDGVNLTELSDEEMRHYRGNRISMIFQDPMTALNPIMTVGDQIIEGIELHNENMKRAEAEKRAGELLEMVGIPATRMVEYPHQFSGGMKQRVVIAMALACDPEIILADEPTTALDVTIQAQILEMIKDLQQKNKTAMILVTHDLGIVAETCKDVAVVYAGEVVESGTVQMIFRNPRHPYTVGLFNSLPNMVGEEERLKPIEGLPPDPTDLPEGCKFNPRCPHATEACRRGTVELHEVEAGHYSRCIL